jgi:hypothetical protein
LFRQRRCRLRGGATLASAYGGGRSERAEGEQRRHNYRGQRQARNLIIIDDPIKLGDAMSEAVRERVACLLRASSLHHRGPSIRLRGRQRRTCFSALRAQGLGHHGA